MTVAAFAAMLVALILRWFKRGWSALTCFAACLAKVEAPTRACRRSRVWGRSGRSAPASIMFLADLAGAFACCGECRVRQSSDKVLGSATRRREVQELIRG
jgi:hypothetical protein